MGRRLLASYLSLALLVLLVLEIPLAITYARTERQNLTTKVERDAVSLASLAEDSLQHGGELRSTAVVGVARGYTDDTGGRVVIVDAKGRALIDTGSGAAGRSFASRPEVARALDGRVATGTRHSDTLATNLLYVAVPVASGGAVHGAVRITYPMSEVDGRVHRYWLILVAIGAVVLAAAAAVGVRFARSIAGPLARVEQAAGAAGAGDLSARAPQEGPPEVRSLARSFNDMVVKLDALIGAQAAFVADASHQLRTPLAALRLRLDNLARDVGPDGRDQLDAATAELERLSGLVDGLLALARADREDGPRAAVDVAAVVDERLATWRDLAAERGVALEGDVEAGLAVRAGAGRLEQALDNLIDNALDVAPSGTAVTVRGVRADGRVEVHVADRGPGMTAAERAHATDRFWRAPAAPPGGSGLGLAIVKRLVEADGGRVELRDADGGGLDAVILLPVAPVTPAPGAAPPPRGGRRR
ncbi:MAG: ATP-binding protein [Actinomycetota bacterium]